MLVRWCLGVVSMSPVLQFTMIWGADVVSFGGQNMLFGMLAVSILAPCGIIERSRLGFREFLINFGAAYVSFFMLVSRSRFLLISGSESGCLRL